MITLLTDFGTSDYFVAAMKGIILGICSEAKIIDITHDIPPQDIQAAAFTLSACYKDFPINTIHLAIVDPGVGSVRRIIIVEAGGYYFVGPDNGIFSYIYSNEQNVKVISVVNIKYLREVVSNTFHGRDIFAPVAAHLANGVTPESFGEEISDYVKFDIAKPVFDHKNKTVTAHIIHIDRFGNCITNLTSKDIFNNLHAKISTRNSIISGIYSHFEQGKDDNELIAYIGSTGRIEIAVRCGSAEKIAGIKRNDEIIVSELH